MNNLYKFEKIDGKGFGCIALKDIKKGTLILEEKPQCANCKKMSESLNFCQKFHFMLCVPEDQIKLQQNLYTTVIYSSHKIRISPQNNGTNPNHPTLGSLTLEFLRESSVSDSGYET